MYVSYQAPSAPVGCCQVLVGLDTRPALAERQNSTSKKHHPSRKQRLKRVADGAEEANSETLHAKRPDENDDAYA
ncbi:hypothetical protein Q1695_000803 [Nippostrongylus brasiliensis]|nr:hypothetical protein Q1695_000803 [Nippostrongylus brasiliensis]